jgi:hypothetical protein
MSMYTYILDAALRERSEPDTPLTTNEAVAIVLDCRRYLGSIASSGWSGDWGSSALSNQVAYDLALIDLARLVGIDCEATSFDQPQQRRIELERKLISRGLEFDELDQKASSTT